MQERLRISLFESYDHCGHWLQSGDEGGNRGNEFAGDLDDASKTNLLLFGGFSRKIHGWVDWVDCVVMTYVNIIFLYGVYYNTYIDTIHIGMSKCPAPD